MHFEMLKMFENKQYEYAFTLFIAVLLCKKAIAK